MDASTVNAKPKSGNGKAGNPTPGNDVKKGKGKPDSNAPENAPQAPESSEKQQPKNGATDTPFGKAVKQAADSGQPKDGKPLVNETGQSSFPEMTDAIRATFDGLIRRAQAEQTKRLEATKEETKLKADIAKMADKYGFTNGYLHGKGSDAVGMQFVTTRKVQIKIGDAALNAFNDDAKTEADAKKTKKKADDDY